MPFGRNELLIAGAVLVIALLVATPLMLSSGLAGRLSELRDQVESLRAAQLDHREAFGTYVGAASAPRTPAELGPDPVAWKPSRGFERLAWAPEPRQAVYASFAVAITEGGFRITGTSDLDGDGERAVIEATQDAPANAVSPPGVY